MLTFVACGDCALKENPRRECVQKRLKPAADPGRLTSNLSQLNNFIGVNTSPQFPLHVHSGPRFSSSSNNNWHALGGPADLTENGIVDVDHLLIVINHWGPC
jgi:hypothetical protein